MKVTNKLQTLSKNIMVTKNKKTSYLVKRIIITNLISLLIVTLTYVWIIYLLSNANSFWEIFRGKDVYVQKDVVPPTKPFLNTIPESTKEDTINISGRSEAGVKIILRIDGQKFQETVSDSEGQFSFSDIIVGFAPQTLYVEAIDETGNVSTPSQTYSIIKDIEEPEFEIITPKNAGETYRATGRTYRVTGKTEAGATVYINEQVAMLSANGEFTASIRLEEGSNGIKIKVVDKAGNEKEEETSVVYEKIE